MPDTVPPPQRVLPAPRRLPLHDVAATRAIEARWLASLPPHTLVTRAGRAAARLLLAIYPHHEHVWIVAGPGNNGSDGLQTAIELQRLGRQVHVTHVPSSSTASSADAQFSLSQAVQAGVPISEAPPTWHQHPGLLIVDALLGIGAQSPLRDPIRAWVTQINQHPAPVLSLDLPSGLDADTGHTSDPAHTVQAAATLSFLTLKPGLFTGLGRTYCGDVWWSDLQCTGTDAFASSRGDLIGADILARQALRQHHHHKGSFGMVSVLGGGAGMHGAAHLAARSALMSGCGRVYLSTLDASSAAHETPGSDSWPEIMTRPVDTAPTGQSDCVTVCGCGGGNAVRAVLPTTLATSPALVLDADALNAIAASPSLQAQLVARASAGQATILTPHPLEAARMLGQDATSVQANRLQAAVDLADQTRSIVVLKGSGTVIATPGKREIRLNSTGNARLATAGTGDVLAGWIAGWWAQGLAPLDAATLAVYQHGLAAEAGSPYATGQRTLRASDLFEHR